MLMYCMLTFCGLSKIVEQRDQITARLRNRQLMGLIVTATNFPFRTMVCEFSLYSVQKLLECDALLPSDLQDPHRQLFDLVHIMIAFAARDKHVSA